MTICAYCGNPAEFNTTSTHLYSHDYGPIWECAPCRAWVGCHPDGKPLGRLANAELRQKKMQAHAVFDPLWKRKMQRDGLKKGHARAKAYKWLAAQLGIERCNCHIGMFDEATCAKVVEICAPFASRQEVKRDPPPTDHLRGAGPRVPAADCVRR